ncbi:MAG: hypothetical protein AAF810_09645 [Cyanobacteria bacterium P01_D01_bin.36]
MTLLAAVPAIAQENAPIQPNNWVPVSDSILFGLGRLENGDRFIEKDSLEYYYDVWPFSAQVGNQIDIIVESEDFDSMVALFSLTEDGTVFEAVNNNINSETTDSLISVDVMRDSEFIVVVVPVEAEEQGSYTVALRSTSLLGSEQQQEELNQVLDEAVELNEVLLEIHKYPLF